MNSSKLSPHDTLSIYVGTPAVNLAVNNWELLSIEHNLKPDGTLLSLDDVSSKLKDPSSFFTQTKSGKSVPKALLIDLDPSPLAEIRQGIYRNLFDSETLINGKFPASLYSVAHSEGKALLPKILDTIRKISDNCQNLDTIMIYSSLSGGSGSGFTGLLLESLADSYERSDRIGVNFYPSKRCENQVFCDFNTAFSMLEVLPHLDASIALQNSALFARCEENFQGPAYYSSINRLVSQLLSGITAGNRCEGSLAIPLSDLKDFLVPSSKMKYLVPSLSPLTPVAKTSEKENSVYELTDSVFCATSSAFAECEVYKDSLFAANLYYRGDVNPKEVARNLEEFAKNMKFTQASSGKFNVALSYAQNAFVPGGDMGRYARSCCALGNGRAFSKVLMRMRDAHEEMVEKKRYLNWVGKYDEGFELMGGDLGNAGEKYRENIELYEGLDAEIVEEIY